MTPDRPAYVLEMESPISQQNLPKLKGEINKELQRSVWTVTQNLQMLAKDKRRNLKLSKENSHQTEETACRVGENLCQLYI
jgi:hypothetical protein